MQIEGTSLAPKPQHPESLLTKYTMHYLSQRSSQQEQDSPSGWPCGHQLGGQIASPSGFKNGDPLFWLTLP